MDYLFQTLSLILIGFTPSKISRIFTHSPFKGGEFELGHPIKFEVSLVHESLLKNNKNKYHIIKSTMIICHKINWLDYC